MVQDFLKKACNSLNITNLHFSRPLVSGDYESHLQICHYLKSKHGSSTLDFSTAAQRQIQSEFDSDLVKYLLNTASLQDRARLHSISTSHAGAWLRAIPNFNLGLSMSPHEFVIAVRLWLGIKMFPSSPATVLCSCDQHIGTFGDHLLSCGIGPERTHRHNALAEVIFQALLVENRDVMREMMCNGSTESHPGDVFHPYFLESGPAYFDMTVRNSCSRYM